MAHSTTTTASHILTKYSKCYISGGSIQSSQADGGGEWQHFVNPVLELVLDIKKSRLNNELESVRLRILWNMDTSGIKNEVLFVSSGQPMPSLPLKAVYRMLSLESAIYTRLSRHLTHSRLFVDFRSLSPRHSALEFIKSIRNVCPCKVNPLPISGNAVTPIRARPTQVARQSFAGSAPSRGVGSRMQASSRPLSSNTAESPRLATSGTRNNMASTSDLTVPASQPSLSSEDSRDPPLQNPARRPRPLCACLLATTFEEAQALLVPLRTWLSSAYASPSSTSQGPQSNRRPRVTTRATIWEIETGQLALPASDGQTKLARHWGATSYGNYEYASQQ
ncbi:proteophosphoglycan [Salix suchowensis]|nr:proteophosphoglycan [Salix suchowensis]